MAERSPISAAGAAGAAASGNGSAARATHRRRGATGGGEDGQQPVRADVAAGTRGRRVGIGHGTALVEDGVTGRAAVVVDGHGEDLREEPRQGRRGGAYGWA